MQKSYRTTLHSALWTLKWLGNCVELPVKISLYLKTEYLYLVLLISVRHTAQMSLSSLSLPQKAAQLVQGELFVCCPVKIPHVGERPHHPHAAVAPVPLWGQSVGCSYCQSQQLPGFGVWVFFVLPKWTSVIRNCMKTSKLISFKPLNSCQTQSTLSIQMCH